MGTQSRAVRLVAGAVAFAGLAVLHAVAAPVHAEQTASAAVDTTPITVTDAPAGERTPVPLRVRGASDQDGLVIRIDYYHDLPYRETYSNCVTPDQEPGFIVCAWPNLRLGAGKVYQIAPSTPLGFDVLDDVPGPVDICRYTFGCGYRAETVGADTATKVLARDGGSMHGPILRLTQVAPDPADSWRAYSRIRLITARNPADVEARGGTIRGRKGAVVSLTVGAANLGPAWWPAPDKNGSDSLIVTLPRGVTLVQKPELCSSMDNRAIRCTMSGLWIDELLQWTFRVKIIKNGPRQSGAVYLDTQPGQNSWYDTNLDLNQANNTAPIRRAVPRR